MENPELQLGDIGRHIITGFTGVVVAKVAYLQGCDQVCLQPQDLKEDGSPKESIYFDAPFVDQVQSQAIPNRRNAAAADDGPGQAPGRSNGTPRPPG